MKQKTTVTLVPEDHRNMSHLDKVPDLVKQKLALSPKKTCVIALEQNHENILETIFEKPKSNLQVEQTKTRGKKKTNNEILNQITTLWTYDDQKPLLQTQSAAYKTMLETIVANLEEDQKVFIVGIDLHVPEKQYNSVRRDTMMSKKILEFAKLGFDNIIFPVGAFHIHCSEDAKEMQGKRLGSLLKGIENVTLEIKNLYDENAIVIEQENAQKRQANIKDEIDQIITEFQNANKQQKNKGRSLYLDEGNTKKKVSRVQVPNVIQYDEQYSDQHIKDILEKSGIQNFQICSVNNGHPVNNETKRCGLVEALEDTDKQIPRFIILNVNVILKNFKDKENNHWVALHIREDQDKRVVEYIDPMGHEINPDVKQLVVHKLQIDDTKIVKIFNDKSRLQVSDIVSEERCNGNDRDCGPFIVESIRILSQNKADDLLQKAQVINNNEVSSKDLGQKLRKEHKDLLKLLQIQNQEEQIQKLNESNIRQKWKDKSRSRSNSEEQDKKKIGQSSQEKDKYKKFKQKSISSLSRSHSSTSSQNKQNQQHKK